MVGLQSDSIRIAGAPRSRHSIKVAREAILA